MSEKPTLIDEDGLCILLRRRSRALGTME